MSVIYLLISISILVAIVFFIAFILAVKKGQYDDDYTPSVRMLFDDELIHSKVEKPKSKNTTTLKYFIIKLNLKLFKPTNN
jgi:cbb3-type cytochrome oxidase maturation protein